MSGWEWVDVVLMHVVKQRASVVLCPLHVRCSIEFSASRAYTRALSDLETQPPNEGFTITDHNKGKGADSPVAYIYNQM